MISTLYTNYRIGIRWNALEATTHYGILLLHNYALYQLAEPAIVSNVALIFSSIYLIVALVNAGFDETITGFFDQITSSIHNTQTLCIYYALTLAILSTLTGVILVSFPYTYSLILTIPYCTLYLATSIIITETVKKTTKKFLYLSLQSRTVALIESITIVSYSGIVWSWYLWYHTIPLTIIFAPMALISGLSMVALLHQCCSIRLQMASATDCSSTLSLWHFTMNRSYNAITQLAKLIFSNNSIVLLCAATTNMQHAATLKLMSDTVQCIGHIAHKTFGISSETFFTHHKKKTTPLFSYTITPLFGIIIFCALNGVTYSLHATHVPLVETFLYETLCIALYFADLVYIPYEKYYLANNNSKLLCLVTSIKTAALYLFLTLCNNSSFPLLFTGIITIHCIALGMLHYCLVKKWSPHYL